MDTTGYWTFKMMDFFSGLRELRQDHELGRQAKREREAVLEVEKERIEGRAPVKIEPSISEFEVSTRNRKKNRLIYSNCLSILHYHHWIYSMQHLRLKDNTLANH